MDDTPDPAEVIADAMHAFCTGRYSTAENAVEDLLHILEAEGYRIVRTDPDLADLMEAIGNQEVDQCAICSDAYCSGAHCIQSMVEDLPEDHQECGERIEKLQDVVRLGRIVQDWLAARALRGEAPTEARPETCPNCDSDDPTYTGSPIRCIHPWHTTEAQETPNG